MNKSCQTNDFNTTISYVPIVAKLNKYLESNKRTSNSLDLGHILVYIRKVLKEFELDFDEKTVKIILELPSEYNICILGILGCCAFDCCTICLKIKKEYPNLWNDWTSTSKLKHVPSIFRNETTISLNEEHDVPFFKKKCEIKPQKITFLNEKSKNQKNRQNILDFRDDTRIGGFNHKLQHYYDSYNIVRLFNNFSNTYDIYHV